MTAAEAAQKDAEKAEELQKAAEKARKEEEEVGEVICVGSKRRRASTVN
jgi:hypothetical protein